MAWADLLAGLAFYLIFEGLFPFMAPARWRRSVNALAGIDDRRLRVFGLVAVALGVALLFGVRG